MTADPVRLQTHAAAALRSVAIVQEIDRRPDLAGELGTICDHARRAAEELRKVCAALAVDRAPVDLSGAVPFHLLDTPDVRALAAGLRELLPIAERIDAARGRALAEVVGGSAGLDLAEDLAQMVARLELEAFGPAASVTGGRE